MRILRPYQLDLKNAVTNQWNNGAVNVIAQLATGGGKTEIMSELFKEHNGAACAIAHRQELVSQISLSLGRVGVYHNIIAPKNVVRFIDRYESIELGKSFFHPQAPVVVAGVKTLIRRDLGSWKSQVTLWAGDECHHFLEGNEWGKSTKLFPNARGVGFTATPGRADGKGLGRHAHGVFDAMVTGPSMRELIDMKFLTDYRVFAPPSDFDVDNVEISKATGEFNPHQLRQASHKSHIVGDVVDQYCKIAAGKLGVTFAVDVETATEIAQRFNAFGIPAAVVSAKTSDQVRTEVIQRFKRRELLQLVNVDLFGEGFDLPAIEVISFARPTQSLALYMQQFGRGLRLLDGKDKAIIIDHVGNIKRHGLPDAPRTWSLDARERGTRGKVDDTVIPVTTCTNCMNVYERIYKSCPFCFFIPEPEGRSRPDQVDGDLFELTPEALAELRGQVSVSMESPEHMKDRLTAGGLSPLIVNSQVKIKREQLEAVTPLIEAINQWGGIRQAEGDSESESYRRFFHRFKTDVLSAQTLNRKDTIELTERIMNDVR